MNDILIQFGCSDSRILLLHTIMVFKDMVFPMMTSQMSSVKKGPISCKLNQSRLIEIIKIVRKHG